MQRAVPRPRRRRRVRMFLTLVQLLGYERLRSFTQDPLFYEAVFFGVISDLHARRDVVDEVREGMIEEGRACFHTMGHLCAITEAGQEDVGQVAFGPDVLRGVERMPFVHDRVADAAIYVVGDGEARVADAVARCPRGEEGEGEGGHGCDGGDLVELKTCDAGAAVVGVGADGAVV